MSLITIIACIPPSVLKKHLAVLPCSREEERERDLLNFLQNADRVCNDEKQRRGKGGRRKEGGESRFGAKIPQF